MNPQTITSSQPHGSGKPAPCHCHDETPSRPQCCQIVCFDRPNYFCGHLLTDADLSLQQRYTIEKNKLYHRALDGHGVVCGLKITCDSQCAGHVLIEEGLAIDDCGNDLVVCETQRFDVLGAARRKKLLVSEPPRDDCDPPRRDRDCDVDQCFYITVCYDEQDGEYETPFQSACASGPKECLPTRVRERVQFDVTDKLPRRRSYLADLEKRLKSCFEIYCDGPIGRLIKDNLKQLQALLGSAESPESGERRDQHNQELRRDRGRDWTNPCDLFCALRAHFLHQIQQKPDEFSCGLYDEVTRLRCPDHDDESMYGEMRDAFRKLLVYMQQYQFDCAFGELLVSCPEPCEAHCLVLGTVEIKRGKLTRVCNSPREYLWAPANIVPVLLHHILTGGLQHDQRGDDKSRREDGRNHEHDKHHCCPKYPNFLPEEMLAEFEYSECGRYLAATSAIKAFGTAADALGHAFDFTDSRAISHDVLQKVAQVAFETNGDEKEVLGINLSLSQEPAAALRGLNPLQSLLADVLARRTDSAVAYRGEGGIARVLPDFYSEISPDPSPVIKRYDETIRQLNEKVVALSLKVTELEKSQPSRRKRSSDDRQSGGDEE